MRHAGPAALDTLEPLLRELRTIDGLRERSRGHFYRGSIGFLHFHKDPTGLYADVKLDRQFERRPVTGPAEQAALLGDVRAVLAAPAARKPGS
jgi:hypothetical protein